MIARITLPVALLCLFAGSAGSQPAPTFEAACGELRGALAKLGEPDEITTIAVRGKLIAVRSDGALVYLFLCDPPAPRVLCVTYETNDSKEGDEVIVTGNLIPRGPDHVQLDPCLHDPVE
jgi:hypothetical protein